MSLEHTSLRAANALHLAMALLSETRTIVTFDRRLREAADGVGRSVVAPGWRSGE